MKKMFTIALAVAALATVGVASAKADDAIFQNFKLKREEWRTQRQAALEKIKQQKEGFKANKEKFTAERCAKILERVQNRISNFDDKKGKHISVYSNLVNRINKFIARFDEKKLDTAALKSHLAELQAKIDKFKEDYAAYIAKLKESKTLTCGHSEGEFKGVLLEAKTLLKTVHDDAADIRTYVKTTILADLKALKAQMPKTENTEDAAKEGAGTANN